VRIVTIRLLVGELAKMAVNRGKQFENVIKEGFLKLPDVSIDRLRDPVGGQLGIRNICDFIVYQYPNQFYFECKAVHGNTLNFKSHISDFQWHGLSEKAKIPGVIAGVLVWFIDHNCTFFVSINELNKSLSAGNKSLNINNIFSEPDMSKSQLILIVGKKKRLFFDYNLQGFLLGLKTMMSEWSKYE
jgi:recombination protein U